MRPAGHSCPVHAGRNTQATAQPSYSAAMAAPPAPQAGLTCDLALPPSRGREAVTALSSTSDLGTLPPAPTAGAARGDGQAVASELKEGSLESLQGDSEQGGDTLGSQ